MSHEPLAPAASDPPAASRRRPAIGPTIRIFLLVEGTSFTAAALVHFGVLVHGYEHPLAPVAESLIAIVLLVGSALTWRWPAQTRSIGLAAQAVSLLATMVGVLTIVIGVGPRTVPDLAFHLTILVVLGRGLVTAGRSPAKGGARESAFRSRVLNVLGAATYLELVLVFAQAVLAGEWLAGPGAMIRVHAANGLAILIVALLQAVLVGVAGVGNRQRRLLAGTTGLFLVLVLVQETLGYAGFDAANQARALHIPNGVLVFGVALTNAYLARRPRGSASGRPHADDVRRT